MSRLRVRVELNRGGVGVPLHKLASVVHESQRFFEMLAEDVHIAQDCGEWLGFDFDNESLNFTAEYVGPVSQEQAQAFYAAFDGVTSLRRATIAQFTQITDAIGEDELIGFGLYQSDQEMEPGEWRSLSRRDALRIADEIQLLLGVAGEMQQETHLPAIIDSDAGSRLFKDRPHRSVAITDQGKLPELVREVESNLNKRIARLEDDVENHSQSIRELRETSAATEESFKGLLNAVENFCGQATRQLERLSPPAELAPAPTPLSAPLSEKVPPADSRRSWRAFLVAAVVAAILITAGLLWWQSLPTVPSVSQNSGSGSPSSVIASTQAPSASEPQPSSEPTPSSEPSPGPAKASPAAPEATAKQSPAATPSHTTPSKPAAMPTATPAKDESAIAPAVPGEGASAEPGAGVMRLEMEAQEPVWVMVTDNEGKILIARTLEANETRTLDLSTSATLRTGNAGGLRLRLNGKDLGPLGPIGKIRDVEFKAGAFKVTTPDAG
ncbi:MAG TPA: RodZ domain-containing protein [Bryobacteraceae bacterium]|nr:RodZ domain-containing protein [Bryobacteraceae bacterium]